MTRQRDCKVPGNRDSLASQRGAGFLELLAIVAFVGILAAVAAPPLMEDFQRQKAQVVATEAVQVMRYVRMMALKEKVPHRVVFNDVSDSPANTIVVQRRQSGSFVTIPGHVYEAPRGVSILGSDSTDSVDSVVVGARGECQTGTVFIKGTGATVEVVSISMTCHASKSQQ